MSNLKFEAEKLTVLVFPERTSLGEQAAEGVAKKVNELLQTKQQISMIFAAAPSQNEFLAAFSSRTDIPFHRINAFHMDEYIGLSDDAPQSFGRFLKDRLFDKVPLHSVHTINGQAEDLPAECRRYAGLLEEFPPDIVCLGIGENGHLAFNDPPANFTETALVKVVTLDTRCRQQQVNDGCFSALDNVPTRAITLTVPALMKAAFLFCMVPGASKAEAVYRTINGSISPDCPATVLRQQENAVLYIDAESASLLWREL